MDYNIFLEKIFTNSKLNVVILGNTIDEEKIAYKIKQEFIKQGINPKCVDKEIKNINDIDENIDLLVLCMNPIKEKMILDSCKLKIKNVLIQPGAESEEVESYLKNNKISYVHGCVLQYYRLFKKR